MIGSVTTGLQAHRSKLPRVFWNAVEQQGLRASAILRQARLPATLQFDRSATIGTAELFAIWQAIEALSDDAGFAIRMVRDTDTATHQLAFITATYAADYRDGLARVARFKRLCSPDELRLQEGNGRVTVSIAWPPNTGREPALSVDSSFAMLIELGRRGAVRPIVPLRIELIRSDPGGAVHADFFGCPVRFGSARDVLVLDAADLDRPFPGHNPELSAMLIPALSAALGEVQGQNGISGQVKSSIKRMLASGRPEIDAVARDLGTSVRTLQRWITAEGATFRTLLADTRRELGGALLSDSTIDIQEVAYLLGYQDTNSFYRAFREWEAVTPGRWRHDALASLPENAG